MNDRTPRPVPHLAAAEGLDSSEQAAFLRLYTKCESSVRGFVRSLVPTHSDASDVMQDVAVVLWRKWRDLDDPGNFEKWAIGVARTQVLSWSRDRARDRLVFREDVLELLATESATFHADADMNPRREALEHCLGKLPLERRTMLERAYAGDMRIDVMAKELNQTAMALYKVLHRLRMKLLGCVEGQLHNGTGDL